MTPKFHFEAWQQSFREDARPVTDAPGHPNSSSTASGSEGYPNNRRAPVSRLVKPRAVQAIQIVPEFHFGVFSIAYIPTYLLLNPLT